MKLVEGPAQPLTLGVTVTVAVTGALSALAATNPPMLPEPAVPKPTSAELVQSKVVPITEPPKVMPGAFAPAQCSRLPIEFTDGVGLTVTVKVVAGPEQPLSVAITLTVAVTGPTGFIALAHFRPPGRHFNA